MMVDKELAQKVVNLLNELIALDCPAVAALLANRVPCNEAMANHPTVQVAVQHGGYNVGMIGILNGLCGTYPDGWGAVAAIFEDNPQDPKGPGNLVRFEVLPQRGSEPVTTDKPETTDKDETFEVSKISTEGGRTFFSRETDRSKLRVLPGVRRIEDTRMTEEQWAAIPDTPEARDFFAGLDQSAKSE